MILRLAICLFFFSFSVYSYLEKQNRCTALMIRLPKVAKEIEAISERNAQLAYQIECFENPDHLLALATDFPHLKFPFAQDVVTVKEGIALQYSEPEEVLVAGSKKPVLIGARP